MQGNLQPWRVEQTETQELQHAIAQRTAEDARHFIVKLHCQQPIERGELFLGDPRGGLLQKFMRNPRAFGKPRDSSRVRARQEAVDDGYRDGSGQACQVRGQAVNAGLG
ncbi:hypothetical protein D3C72_940350 [compost metagenome]